MKAHFLKAGGVNTEEEFYQKFPTEEHFFQANPHMRSYRQGGAPTADEFYQMGVTPSYFFKSGGAPTANEFYQAGYIPGSDFFYADGGENCPECMEQMKSGGNWIQSATKNMRTDKPCTGAKFGSSSCPPGSKRYNLAKTFRAMAHKEDGGEHFDGITSDDILAKRKATIMNFIKSNTMNNLADQEAEQTFMQIGGGMTMTDYGYNPNKKIDMYGQAADRLNNPNVMNNFSNATANLGTTAQDYMDFNVAQAAYGLEMFQNAGTVGPQIGPDGKIINANTTHANSGQGMASDGNATDQTTQKKQWEEWYNEKMKSQPQQQGYTYGSNMAYNPQMGMNYFPMNYGYQSKWSGDLEGMKNMDWKNTKLHGMAIEKEYGMGDRFLGMFRGKNADGSKKHTFGSKKDRFEFTFRTYKDPVTGEIKQIQSKGPGTLSIDPKLNIDNRDDQMKMVDPNQKYPKMNINQIRNNYEKSQMNSIPEHLQGRGSSPMDWGSRGVFGTDSQYQLDLRKDEFMNNQQPRNISLSPEQQDYENNRISPQIQGRSIQPFIGPQGQMQGYKTPGFMDNWRHKRNINNMFQDRRNYQNLQNQIQFTSPRISNEDSMRESQDLERQMQFDQSFRPQDNTLMLYGGNFFQSGGQPDPFKLRDIPDFNMNNTINPFIQGQNANPGDPDYNPTEKYMDWGSRQDYTAMPKLDPRKATSVDPMAGPKDEQGNAYTDTKITGEMKRKYDPEAMVNWAINGAIPALTNFANRPERMAMERKQMAMTTADNNFITSPSGNRGDYDQFGNFRPDQHVEKRNTGFGIPQYTAKFGYEVDQEYDMTPDELQQFMAAGGQVELM